MQLFFFLRTQISIMNKPHKSKNINKPYSQIVCLTKTNLSSLEFQSWGIKPVIDLTFSPPLRLLWIRLDQCHLVMDKHTISKCQGHVHETTRMKTSFALRWVWMPPSGSNERPRSFSIRLVAAWPEVTARATSTYTAPPAGFILNWRFGSPFCSLTGEGFFFVVIVAFWRIAPSWVDQLQNRGSKLSRELHLSSQPTAY